MKNQPHDSQLYSDLGRPTDYFSFNPVLTQVLVCIILKNGDNA